MKKSILLLASIMMLFKSYAQVEFKAKEIALLFKMSFTDIQKYLVSKRYSFSNKQTMGEDPVYTFSRHGFDGEYEFVIVLHNGKPDAISEMEIATNFNNSILYLKEAGYSYIDGSFIKPNGDRINVPERQLRLYPEGGLYGFRNTKLKMTCDIVFPIDFSNNHFSYAMNYSNDIH